MTINTSTIYIRNLLMKGALVALALMGVGTQAFAGGTPSLYIAVTTGQAAVGSKIAVQLKENSGTTGVNAVSAQLTYPSNILHFVSLDATGSNFDIDANSSASNTTITVNRGHAGSLTGDQFIATVYFTVTGSGTAAMGFGSGSAVVSSTTNMDIGEGKSGASYSLQSSDQITGCSAIEQQSSQVLRLYDPVTFKHFYTPYLCEYYALPRIAGYRAEGASWNTTAATNPGAVPVWRLYNTTTHIHFWTTQQADIDSATAHSGYVVEGIGFYAISPTATPIFPVYRMYNPVTFQHLWTLSSAEVSAATSGAGYRLEGTAFSSQ
jgi:hypothetical protein